jgi:hypothetical protein
MLDNFMDPVEDAHLCSACDEVMYVHMLGTCQECGRETHSDAFLICLSCAQQRDICQICLETTV